MKWEYVNEWLVDKTVAGGRHSLLEYAVPKCAWRGRSKPVRI